jgi:hypothetical protein
MSVVCKVAVYKEVNTMRLWLLALGLLIGCQVPCTANILRLQDATAPPGGTAEVTLSVDAGVKGLIAGLVLFEVGLPELKDAPSITPLTDASITAKGLIPGLMWAVNADFQNGVLLAFAGSDPANGPGSILSLRLPVPANAPVGARYPLQVKNVRLEALDGTSLKVTTLDGTIRVVSPLTEGAALFIPEVQARPGATVDMEVLANSLLPAIQSADITIAFAQSTPAGLPPLVISEGSVQPGGLFREPQFAARIIEGRILRAAIASNEAISGPGALLRFRVTVPASVPSGSTYAFQLQATVGLIDREWVVNTLGGRLTVTDETVTPRGTVSLQDASGRPGEVVSVIISADAAVSIIASIALTLRFDPSLVISQADIKAGPLLAGPLMAANTNTPGQVTLGLVSSQNSKGPGEIARLNFRIPQSARVGDAYPITIASGEVVDAEGRTINVSFQGATVKVTGRRKGDVNGDGVVNVADAVLALRFAVLLAEPSADQLSAADLNGDGRVTIPEVSTILRAALGLAQLD